MVRHNFREDEFPGFSRYWKDKESKGILLPVTTAQAIQAEEEAVAAQAQKTTTKRVRLGGKPLPKIRVQTDHDIADAVSFA